MSFSPNSSQQPRSRPQARSLQQRWSQTWQLEPSCLSPDSAIHSLESFWQDLRSRYQEPHRAYHTLAHIADCFNRWDALLAQGAIAATNATGTIAATNAAGAIGTIDEIVHWTDLDRFCLEMALWCHDAIYTVTLGEQSPDRPPLNPEHLPLRNEAQNEAQSAQWAGQWLQKLGLESAPIDRIQTLIQATAHSNTPHSRDPVLPWLLDLDLAILGTNAAAFQRYEAQIRQEYAALSDLHFHQGRHAFIQQLLQQPWIYHTSHCRHQWEPQAKINLRQYWR